MKKEVKKLMNKGFLLSVGLASLTIDKADKIVKELIKKGNLNETQGRRLVSDLIKKSKNEKKKLEKNFRRIRVTKKR